MKLLTPNSEKFFNNPECKYYPCHTLNEINCLFCYCPLYHLEDCEGDAKTLSNGVKDCSNCTYPHEAKNWINITKRLSKK